MSEGTDKFIIIDDAKPIIKQMLKEVHSRLKHVRTVAVFCYDAVKDKGREVGGKVSIISGVNAFLVNEFSDQPHEDFFLLQINKEAWELFSEAQRKAQIDQLLTSCKFEEGKLATKPFDFMEHTEVFARHGAWNHDLQEMKKLATQPLLPNAEAETKGKKNKVTVIKSPDAKATPISTV